MKKFQCCFALVAVAMFAGCGDDGDGGNPDSRPRADAPPTIDSPPQIDAPPACTAVTSMPQDFAGIGTNAVAWFAQLDQDLGDGGPAFLRFEYWINTPNGADLTGTWDLADGIDANYATCSTCILGLSTNADGEVVRIFFQSAGTANITQDPHATQTMAGTLANTTLVEVTIDPDTAMSTPVPGGECLNLGASYALDADNIPNAWTCDTADYGDGTACNCMCGVPDPDCANPALPIEGCAAGQVCDGTGMCQDPPPNDTCQTAVVLTLGTPVTGSTVGAANDYDNGLQTATCTGFSQPGADVAYRVALTAGTEYTFLLSGLDANYDGSLSLIRQGAPAVCDADPIACRAGSDAGFNGDDETFTFTPTVNGTYQVIVDSFFAVGNPSGSGAFTLTVSGP